MKARRYIFEDVRVETRHCDWHDCTSHGTYEAPKSRDRLHDYYHFALNMCVYTTPSGTFTRVYQLKK